MKPIEYCDFPSQFYENGKVNVMYDMAGDIEVCIVDIWEGKNANTHVFEFDKDKKAWIKARKEIAKMHTSTEE